jgi:RNA polymerase sigma factor (sigma-70 family)
MDDDRNVLERMDTKDLLERIICGESQAIGEIWRRHYRRMHELATQSLRRYRGLSRRYEADEFLHDVVGRLTKLAVRGQLRHDTSLANDFWLLFRDVLRQSIRDEVERLSAIKRGGDGPRNPDREGKRRTFFQGPRAGPAVPEDLDMIESDELGPEPLAMLDEVMERLFDRLNEQQRLVLTYRFSLMTIPEIAEKTGLSERTISRRVKQIQQIYSRL